MYVFELNSLFARFPRCNSGKLKNIDGFSNFIPFIMYSNCNRLARGGGGDLSNYSLTVCLSVVSMHIARAPRS